MWGNKFMSKRLIGYGYTNANGVATLDYDAEGNELSSSGYVGQGVGNVDISASAVIDGSTFVSETYSIYDCTYFDDTSTNTTSRYFINTQSGTSISYENNKVKITCGSQNGRNMIELRTPTIPFASISGERVRFEVDLSGIPNSMRCNIIQTINGTSVTTNGEIITEDGTCYVEADIDPTATLVRFQVRPISSVENDTYYITNFKVYPI